MDNIKKLITINKNIFKILETHTDRLNSLEESFILLIKKLKRLDYKGGKK